MSYKYIYFESDTEFEGSKYLANVRYPVSRSLHVACVLGKIEGAKFAKTRNAPKSNVKESKKRNVVVKTTHVEQTESDSF